MGRGREPPPLVLARRNAGVGVTMLRPTDDVPCNCWLLTGEHMRSAHEGVDPERLLRLYLEHVPIAGHARTTERMYAAGHAAEARAVQRMFEDVDKRRRVAVRRRRSA